MAETIKTPADQLLELLTKAKSKISVEEIADNLKMPIEQVEEWADVLEEHGLVDVQYSPLHGMAIKPKIHQMKQEELKEKVREVKPRLERPRIAFFKNLKAALARTQVKRQQIKQKHEVIRGKFIHASEKIGMLPKTHPQVQELKREKISLRKELDDLRKHVSEMHKAPPKEVKKPRFIHYVAKTEHKAREIEKRTDEFTQKIEELEKDIQKHKERRH